MTSTPPTPKEWLQSRYPNGTDDIFMEVYNRISDKTRLIGEIGRDLQDLAALLVIGNRK